MHPQTEHCRAAYVNSTARIGHVSWYVDSFWWVPTHTFSSPIDLDVMESVILSRALCEVRNYTKLGWLWLYLPVLLLWVELAGACFPLRIYLLHVSNSLSHSLERSSWYTRGLAAMPTHWTMTATKADVKWWACLLFATLVSRSTSACLKWTLWILTGLDALLSSYQPIFIAHHGKAGQRAYRPPLVCPCRNCWISFDVERRSPSFLPCSTCVVSKCCYTA